MLRLVAGLFAALLLALPAAGQDFDKGVAAHGRGDYAAALKEWRPLAEQGNARAQNNLGTMYAEGEGVKQDHAEAVKWFRRAAEQGHASAQNNLGTMYAEGEGVPQDHAEAVKWYRRAAEQGEAIAQNNLGVRYAKGQGVPQDHAEAVKWYRRAAEQGDVQAQFNLGVRYDKGEGVPQDYVRAHLWFNLAASTLKEPKERERAARNRDLVAAKMTPAQIAEAQRLAREWKPKTWEEVQAMERQAGKRR